MIIIINHYFLLNMNTSHQVFALFLHFDIFYSFIYRYHIDSSNSPQNYKKHNSI